MAAANGTMPYIETQSGPAARPAPPPEKAQQAAAPPPLVVVVDAADGSSSTLAAPPTTAAAAATAAAADPAKKSKLDSVLASATKVASFLPLAVLPALRDTHAIAALAACVLISALTLLATLVLRRRGALVVWPKRLDVVSFAVYAAMLIASFFKEHEVGVWASAVQNCALFAFMLATVLLKDPFTADWAKDNAPPVAWSTPLFLWTCNSIAWTWSTAMGVMAVGSLAMAARPDWRPVPGAPGPKPWQYWLFGVGLGLAPLPLAIAGQHAIVHVSRKRAAALRARHAADEAKEAKEPAAAGGREDEGGGYVPPALPVSAAAVAAAAAEGAAAAPAAVTGPAAV